MYASAWEDSRLHEYRLGKPVRESYEYMKQAVTPSITGPGKAGVWHTSVRFVVFPMQQECSEKVYTASMKHDKVCLTPHLQTRLTVPGYQVNAWTFQ